jgi:hypothetical protein
MTPPTDSFAAERSDAAMILTDEQQGIVNGTAIYAGPNMDPDDQAFYLRWWVLYDDCSAREDANLAKLVEAGILEIHPETEGPVLTAAAIEAAVQP